MNNVENNKVEVKKRTYQQPKVESVKLDTEISLVMNSAIPENPMGGNISKLMKFGL
jgi:hypothetical protein